MERDSRVGQAGAFTFPGTRSLGCVLVHGFTATPDEMRPLGEALAARGFPIHGVRLAGHDATVEDLERGRWTDWLASVEAGLLQQRQTTTRVALVGMSLGALLALHLAAHRPREVEALVLCGTPFAAPAGRARWLPLLAHIPWVARRWRIIPKRGDGPDISDPAARAASRSHRVMPLAAVLELLAFQRVVRREVRRVRQPALLLHGRHDHSAPVANLALLERALGSSHVEAHVLERSWHVVTLDVERDEVARLAGDFLERIERGL